jgi:large subunit ribosomal protein L10
MAKEKKILVVSGLKDKFSRANIMLITDYRGLSAKEINELRRHLDRSGVEYRVVKNTLARLAANQVGKEIAVPLFDGPVAIAFGYEDEVKLARSLVEYIRDSGSVLQIKGGVMGDRVLDRKDVQTLATLPAKEILVSQLVGQMLSPLQSLHNVLMAPLRGMSVLLQARMRQLEGG